MSPLARSTIAFAAFLAAQQIAFSQTTGAVNSAIRVTMSVNEDGSHTVYKFNDAKHTASATATDPDGKVRQKIRYQLDDAGRFATAQVLSADGKLRFKSRYKYDGAGRLEEETQLTAADAVMHRIVYNYDAAGKPTSYSVLDADGKLINRVAPIALPPSTSAKPRQKSGKP
jgi:YD repeat-containing protein